MLDNLAGTEIAVVGMAGRFPGAKNITEFWQNLRDGVLSIRPLSEEELDALGVDDATRQDPNYVPVSAAIDDYDKFDAPFFDYTPREAEIMDPQQRVFLEACWEALEHTGYDPQQYDGLIGVFAGSTTSNYLIYNLVSNKQIFDNIDAGQFDIGNGADFVATRVSYKLNLKGPSFSVQTACSTSMVATHLACQALLNEECDMAIAGGVSVHIDHPKGYKFVEGSILSPDGNVRAFDAEANGSVFGGGTGVIVLKRLEDALEEGDHIHAVILGSAINNDGSNKVGYVAPSVDGQSATIVEAMAVADVEADSISYVETHGAGTRLGDPIEIRALTKAFRASTDLTQYCSIGSVKTNIGHLTGGAGIAGLLKTVLSIENKQIPPTLGFETPNPECFFEQSPFMPNVALKDWDVEEHPRRAGVSSFGLGGTNAHMILEEMPEREVELDDPRPMQLVTLSAKTESALQTATTNLLTHLKENPDLPLEDVAYTLKVGRQGMRYRRWLVAESMEDVVNGLEETAVHSIPQQDKHLLFALPASDGWDGLGWELYETEPTFQEAVDECAEIVSQRLPIDMRDVWQDEAVETVQSVILALNATRQYALAKLWMSWGVTPQALFGLGVGELVVACLAEVLSLEDMLTVVCAHGRTGGALGQRMQKVTLNVPQMPYVSSQTGTWITLEQATDPYYYDHLLSQNEAQTAWQTISQTPQYLVVALGVSAPEVGELPVVACLGEDEATTLLSALALVWQNGVFINWNLYYEVESRQRLILPTYPFERQRYWIEAGEATAVEDKPLVKKRNLADWLYAPAWESKAPALPIQPSALTESEHWLILASAEEPIVAEAVMSWLKEAGQTVTLAKMGAEFASTEAGYTLHAGTPSDYQKLVEQAGYPQRVLHLGSLTTSPAPTSLSALAHVRAVGYDSLIYLAQALGAEPVQIDVLTNFAYQVMETEPINPEKGLILGACRVLPQEFAHLTCRVLDVTVPATVSKNWLSGLFGELQTAVTSKTMALRGRSRWTPTYAELPIEAEATASISLRPNGVYLITGGLSDIGLELAKYLAQAVQARLVLVDDSGEDVTDLLKEQGASEVLIVRGNVHEEAVLQTAVQQTVTRFQTINGVIHAPSIQNDQAFRPIADVTAESSDWHFVPKLHGLYALDAVLNQQTLPDLDFCLVNSALSVALGGVGFATFTATAHVLDAFVHHRTQTTDVAWFAINWDVWSFDEEGLTAVGSNLAQLALTPTEGGDIFQRIITASPVPQLLVSTGDLLQRIREGEKKSLALRNSQDQTLYDRPDLWTEYVAASTEMEEQVVAIWQKLLGINQIGINDNFFDLGGHSLLATQLRNQIYEVFQAELPIQGLLENATPAGVVELIETHRPSGEMARPIKERLREAFPSERPAIMEGYLRHKIANGLEVSVDTIPENGDLSGFDNLNLATVDLMWHLKQEFKIQFYPHEIMGRPQITDLTEFLLEQVEKMANLPAYSTDKPLSSYTIKQHRESNPIVPSEQKNDSMVFLLSAPRSGSTIFRVMLAGHPEIFCPPEISLLFFDTMQEWQENVSFGQDFQWPAEGLHWAIVELMGIEPEEGWRVIDQMVQENRSVQSVYAQLQELAGDRLLLDKTPPYAMDIDTLRRGEARFNNAKYIHLVRHPYAMMESFLRVRLDQQFSSSLFEEVNPDPYIIAETIWSTANRNLNTFLTNEVPADQVRVVRYEDLVTKPREIMTDLCEFLEIPFNEALLNPYDGRKERMLGGIGDPNIMQHSGIDPALADAWKKVRLPRYLDETTKELARKFNYELPENVLIPENRVVREEVEDVVEGETAVEELSDDEVTAMLQQLLAQGGE